MSHMDTYPYSGKNIVSRTMAFREDRKGCLRFAAACLPAGGILYVVGAPGLGAGLMGLAVLGAFLALSRQ